MKPPTQCLRQQALSRPLPTKRCASLNLQEKKNSMPRSEQSAYRCLEDVVGCKWSVSVLLALRDGVLRPGELERHIDGISTKVLNERLRKLLKYGLVAQQRFAESPPRTEYRLTPFGDELTALIERIRQLDDMTPR
jgi:DNA-binding HxlR family transcriptional regulator